ncbi:AMP-binding protein, partial [Streptomyces sp. SID10244]|nr:AMP-binding protein [Streptomyces sp. SID10244]
WYLRDVIARHAVTTTHFVPSMLAAFAAAHGGDDGVVDDLRSLRRIVTSGEALTPETVAAVGRLTDAPVHNLYGPTEAAV